MSKIASEVKIISPGINYVVHVPMDSGTISGLYKPYAMLANMPFKITVQIGNKSYLPIEMIGEIKKIGLPGQTTNLDLTMRILMEMGRCLGEGVIKKWR